MEKEDGTTSYIFIMEKPDTDLEAQYIMENYVLIEFPDGKINEMKIKYIPLDGKYFSSMSEFEANIAISTVNNEQIGNFNINFKILPHYNEPCYAGISTFTAGGYTYNVVTYCDGCSN